MSTENALLIALGTVVGFWVVTTACLLCMWRIDQLRTLALVRELFTMDWTTTPPTEPGWYWVHTPVTDGPEIVEAIARNGGIGRFAMAPDGRTPIFVLFTQFREYADPSTKWAGPIPLPGGDLPRG